MAKLEIREETEAHQKQLIVATILAGLPEWFGLPDSTADYVAEAAKIRLWAAYIDGDLAGFIDLNATSEQTAEISCMGVLKSFHRQGIGTALLNQLESKARQKYRFLQVKTVARGYYPQYDATGAFYLSKGFSELEIFPTLWDSWNPCQILIKALR